MAGVAALAYLDPGQIGGAIQANTTGFDWFWVVAYRDLNAGTKAVVSGVNSQSLDADTLGQIATKAGAAIKADGATRGFAVNTVTFPQFTTIAV